MNILAQYQRRFIDWITFDPDNPFMPYDPRTPDMKELPHERLVLYWERAEREEKTILDVLIFDVRRICCRLYYLKKLKV